MRSISIVAAAVVASLATDGAMAQPSFFNKRYCLSSSGRSSVPDCSYNSWEQCRASVFGSKYCFENPFWKAAPANTTKRRR
jgi:hypothetical protein